MRSCALLCIQEFSAERISFELTESLCILSSRIRRGALIFVQPETAALPAATGKLKLSPTRADASSTEVPSRTTPSAGTISPACTSISDPTGSPEALTALTASPLTRFAFSGRSAYSAETLSFCCDSTYERERSAIFRQIMIAAAPNQAPAHRAIKPAAVTISSRPRTMPMKAS